MGVRRVLGDSWGSNGPFREIMCTEKTKIATLFSCKLGTSNGCLGITRAMCYIQV